MRPQVRFVTAPVKREKSVALTYVLWLCLGGVGVHRYYNGRVGSGVAIAFLTVVGLATVGAGIGVLLFLAGAIWWLVDAFLIPGWVSRRNAGSSVRRTTTRPKVNWAAAARIMRHGPLNPRVICPHCGVQGAVHVQPVSVKTGISGGKVMGGMLTGGLSLLATGLSQARRMTEAHCGNCFSTWRF